MTRPRVRWLAAPLVAFLASRLLQVVAMITAIGAMPQGPEVQHPQRISEVLYRELAHAGHAEHLASSLALATGAFLLALIAFDRLLARCGEDEDTRWRSLFYLSTFPGAVFFTVSTSQSLTALGAGLTLWLAASLATTRSPAFGRGAAVAYGIAMVVGALVLPEGWRYLSVNLPLFQVLGRWGRNELFDRVVTASFCVAFGLASGFMARSAV